MDELNVDRMCKSLVELDVAWEQYETALAYLYQAKLPFANAIDLLQKAMDEDSIVLDALDEVEECRRLLDRARADAETVGALVWKDGLTESKKEWTQEGYEVRVRTSLSPEVTDYESFLAHLKEIEAGGIIKAVDVKLNKKAATDLNARIPLRGLKVEERTTCSVMKSHRLVGEEKES